MKLRYKYRIYPTNSQEQQMILVGGSVRFVYNYFLKSNIDQYRPISTNIDQYAIDKKFVWYFDMNKQLTQLKKQYIWLNETYSQVLQQSTKDLDQALKNIKHGAGFPHFKSKYTTPISFRYQQHVSIIDSKYVRLPKIGNIRIKMHRELPSNFTGCTISQTPRGWYISFIVGIDEKTLVDDISKPVGIDLNSQNIALSNSELIANPRPLKSAQPKVKKLQRNLSRKQKGSKNRGKAKNKLARLHNKIKNQRLDHIHQTSARIAKDHDLVSVETLKIDQMRQSNKYTAKAIADAGWAMLINTLTYKCQLLGHHLIKINQWLPSTKQCSGCQAKKKSMPLHIRIFICDKCGLIIHRDVNAAINICIWGYQQWLIKYGKTGQELPNGPVDVIWDILVNHNKITQSQTKQEATCSLDT